MIGEKCRDPLQMTLLYSTPAGEIWVGGSVFLLPQLTFQQEVMKEQRNRKKKDILELVCLYFGSSFSGALSSQQYLIQYALPRKHVNTVGAHSEDDCAGRRTWATA